MSLHAEAVFKDFKDIQTLNQINNEAFPDEERLPFDKLLELTENKNIDLLSLFDKDNVIRI